MKIITTHVYLLISPVPPHDCFGVLSISLYRGENSGVNYLHHRNILFQYYDINDSIER
ncbi:MAG: hypothetical protein J6P12_08855 [Methanobrevibacter sp.]|nr:hypothetical protein [Methanobrevibacter sp.]